MRKLRVMVVDDQILYRKVLRTVINEISVFELVGVVSSGQVAHSRIPDARPDIVFLDIFMPDMDGLETLAMIRADYPDILVVMISGVAKRDAAEVIDALKLGAIDFIEKPSEGSVERNIDLLIKNINAIMPALKSRVARAESTGQKRTTYTTRATPLPMPMRLSKEYNFKVLAIGVSTGGPEALAKFISQLPADFPLPVLIVQHMPPTFTSYLADSLDPMSNLRVVEASNAEVLSRGKVYIAPGSHHMVVRVHDGERKIYLDDGVAVNSCKPSVDVLFNSLALTYDDYEVLSVVLTGMGKDGLSGVRALKEKHGYTITQSEESSAIYGMPKAVYEAGLSDHQEDIGNMAITVTRATTVR